MLLTDRRGGYSMELIPGRPGRDRGDSMTGMEFSDQPDFSDPSPYDIIQSPFLLASPLLSAGPVSSSLYGYSSITAPMFSSPLIGIDDRETYLDGPFETPTLDDLKGTPWQRGPTYPRRASSFDDEADHSPVRSPSSRSRPTDIAPRNSRSPRASPSSRASPSYEDLYVGALQPPAFPPPPLWDEAHQLKLYRDLVLYKCDPCPNVKNHPWKKCFYFHRERPRRDPFRFLYRPSFCTAIRHEETRMREEENKEPRRSQFLSAGAQCPNGDACLWMHTKEEQLFHPLHYKTAQCVYQGGREGKCENFMCPFIHADPSPIYLHPGLKNLCLYVLGLQSPRENDKAHPPVDATDALKSEFFKLATGECDPPDDPTYFTRGYLRLWLRGFYAQLVRNDGTDLEFTNFLMTRAKLFMD